MDASRDAFDRATDEGNARIGEDLDGVARPAPGPATVAAVALSAPAPGSVASGKPASVPELGKLLAGLWSSMQPQATAAAVRPQSGPVVPVAASAAPRRPKWLGWAAIVAGVLLLWWVAAD